jgi:hypothetical protein
MLPEGSVTGLWVDRICTLTISPREIQLTGTLNEPETESDYALAKLLPPMQFQMVGASGKPVPGYLEFRAIGSQLTDCDFEVIPARWELAHESPPVMLQLRVKGRGLKEAFGSELSKLADAVKLEWRFSDAKGSGRSNIGGASQAFYGEHTAPISLELVRRAKPVELEVVQPVARFLAEDNRLDLGSVPRAGEVAKLQADFSKLVEPGSLRVRLLDAGASRWVHLNAGDATGLVLTGAGSASPKQTFSLIAEAPPGADRLLVRLESLPESKNLILRPKEVEITLIFEPTALETVWLVEGKDGMDTATPPPPELDLGLYYMVGNQAGGVAKPASAKATTSRLKVTIPNGAVRLPAAECRITGPNADAFRLVLTEEKNGTDNAQTVVITNTLHFLIEPRYVYFDAKHPTQTNLTALLELRANGNYVLKAAPTSAASGATNFLVMRLKASAIVQPDE